MQSRERLIPVLDSDEVAREATALAHEFRRIARLQYLKLAAVSIALLIVSFVAFQYWNWPLGLFVLVLIVVVFINNTNASRRRQMEVSLPTVLRSLGLEQTSEGPGFLQSLPARLFPRVGDTKVLSVFSGSVDGFPVAIAEVEVRDQKGDTSEMIFEGLVLRVALPVPMQDFLVLDAELSRKMEMTCAPSFFTRKPHIDVSFLERNPAFTSGVHGLRLWSAPSVDPATQPLDSILRVLSYPPAEAAIAGRIHSATNDDKAIFVALRPTDAPGRIDWTSASGPNASLVIHLTFAWLTQPMALGKDLIAATNHDAKS